MEKWKPIKGYEGLYEVSDTGCVKALASTYIKSDGKKDYRKEHLLKLRENPKSGYVQVGLRKQGESCKQYYVHRLVADAFIDNPNNYPEVNHRDEVKTNNSITNLEWCNRDYNLNYGTRKDKYYKPVECVDDLGNVIKSYKCIRDAEVDGFKNQSITRSCKKGYKHYGYYFRYTV